MYQGDREASYTSIHHTIRLTIINSINTSHTINMINTIDTINNTISTRAY